MEEIKQHLPDEQDNTEVQKGSLSLSWSQIAILCLFPVFACAIVFGSRIGSDIKLSLIVLTVLAVILVGCAVYMGLIWRPQTKRDHPPRTSELARIGEGNPRPAPSDKELRDREKFFEMVGRDFELFEKHPKPPRCFAWLPLPLFASEDHPENGNCIYEIGYCWLTTVNQRWMVSGGGAVSFVYLEDNPGVRYLKVWQFFVALFALCGFLAWVWKNYL